MQLLTMDKNTLCVEPNYKVAILVAGCNCQQIAEFDFWKSDLQKSQQAQCRSFYFCKIGTKESEWGAKWVPCTTYWEIVARNILSYFQREGYDPRLSMRPIIRVRGGGLHRKAFQFFEYQNSVTIPITESEFSEFWDPTNSHIFEYVEFCATLDFWAL